MTRRVTTLIAMTVGLVGLPIQGALAVTLTNPSFEAGADGSYAAPGWTGFNDAFTSTDQALTDSKSLKVFGPFFEGGGAGVFQGGFPATAGELWTASASILSPASDAISGNNFAITKLEFLNAANAVIGAFESSHFNESSPLDTWVEKTVQGVAPAGTASAQIVLVHVQLAPVSGGAVYYDDASLALVPEPATLALCGLGAIGMLVTRRRANKR